MKYIQILLLCSLLCCCGYGGGVPANTSTPLPTATIITPTIRPSITPTPNAAKTQLAFIGLTLTQQISNAHATQTQHVLSSDMTLESFLSYVAQLPLDTVDMSNVPLDQAKLVYGPYDDSLRRLDKNFIVPFNPDLRLKNFVAHIKFVNPYDTATIGNWDYGLLFRNKYSDKQYRLVILSDQTWTFYYGVTEQYQYSSKNEILNIKEGETNELWVVVVDDACYLFINSTFIKKLKIGNDQSGGDVSPAIGLYYGNSNAPKATKFKEFTVWSLP